MVSIRTFALLALAAAVSWPAAAQPVRGPGEELILLSELVGRDGATPFYTGNITWTNREDAVESVSVRVTDGRVNCVGTYRGSEGTKIIDGPGLLEMSLGQGDNDKYSFRVACPNATTPGEPADFRHSYDSYEQPGGTVELTKDLKKAKLPRVLEGRRSETYDGGGSIGMTWKLCTRASDCPPPPKKPPLSPSAAPPSSP